MKLRLTDDELNTIESLSDAELAGLVRDGVRHYQATRDAAGSGLGARELEENDQPRAQDDPPHTPGTPSPPDRPGASLAATDSALRAMREAIPGYGRLR